MNNVTAILHKIKCICRWSLWKYQPIYSIKQIIEVSNKENIKAAHGWSFMRGIHQWQVDSPHKGFNNMERVPMSWRHHVYVSGDKERTLNDALTSSHTCGSSPTMTFDPSVRKSAVRRSMRTVILSSSSRSPMQPFGSSLRVTSICSTPKDNINKDTMS